MKKMISRICMLMLCLAIPFSFAGCAAKGNKETPKTDTVDNAKEGKKVYFAGPLFNQAEKDFNLKIVKVLEDKGYQVFIAQRDGIEAAKLEGKSEEELVKMIFSLDFDKIKESDILFMNLDGRIPDDGACIELGIAHAVGKRCYGFKTDTRSFQSKLDLNPMISGCMTKIFKNYNGDELIKEIEQYISNKEL